jgi:WD40 repeat protein
MKLGYSLTAALMGTVAVVGLVQLAVSLTPTQVNEIAKKITVRIDGAAPGTGVIVKKEGNTYTVLTNHHVVAKSGKYTAKIGDKSYPVNAQTIKKLGNVDLAVFEFASSEIYQVAELGDSDQISEGIPVHVVGWAAPDAVNPERGYVFTNGSISRRVAKAKNGYALVYTNTVKPGMSGGAVLNEEGRLVGINGLAVIDNNTGGTDYLGIPINTYVKLATLPSSPPVTVVPSPRRTPPITAPPPEINPGNSSLVATLTGNSERVNVLAYSPNGKTLASGYQEGFIKIWDVASGKTLHTLTPTGDGFGVHRLAYNPNGKALASVSDDKIITIWDVASGKTLRTLTGHSDLVYALAYSLDGKTLASGGGEKTIKIWDVASGKTLRTLTGHSYSVNALAYNPNGKTLASGSEDKTIKIWDVSSGKTLRTLTGHSDGVNALAYNPNGKTLASGSRDKTIKIWDVSSGKTLRTLTGHYEGVFSVAVSPDGRTLVSGSWDKTIKIWDIRSGELQRTLTGDSDSVIFVAISPDGQSIASGSYDKTIKIWRIAGR